MKPTIIFLPLCLYLMAIAGFTLPQNGTTPVVMLKGQEKNKIPANKLHELTRLDIEDENDQNSWTIESFSVVLVPKHLDPQQVKNKGAVFSKDLMKLLSQTARGDKIYFENIKLVNHHSDTLEQFLMLQIK